MNFIKDIIEKTKERRIRDKIRYKNLNENKCMLCGVEGNDRRSLFMKCFYDLSEVVPEMIDLFECGEDLKKKGWFMKICKSCRGVLLQKMEDWRNECLKRMINDRRKQSYKN